MKQTQKYLAEQERIARIAFKLFAETGYAKTPLSVIGKEAGVQKSLLQYYFPKKSKFIELFIETSFSLVIDQVIESIRAREAEEAAAAIDEENYNTAQLVVQCICDWIFEHLSDLDDEMKDRLYDTITFCVGGGFEYACMKFEKNEPVDVGYIVANAMDFVVSALGFDPALFKIRKEMSTEWLLRTADAVDAVTFGG